MRYSITCPRCTVEQQLLVTLGRPGDPVDIGSAAVLERDSRGRFHTVAQDRYGVVVFDFTGRYVASQLHRMRLRRHQEW